MHCIKQMKWHYSSFHFTVLSEFSSVRDAGYMRIYDCICDCIFCQNRISHIFLHIMAFSKSRGNCRMCKNLHICRMFLHMQSHFVSRLIFFCIVFVDFANLIVKQHVCLQLSTCLSATHLLYIAVMSHVAYQLVCCLVNWWPLMYCVTDWFWCQMKVS